MYVTGRRQGARLSGQLPVSPSTAPSGSSSRQVSAVVMSSARITISPSDLTGSIPCSLREALRSVKVQPSYSLGFSAARRVSTTRVGHPALLSEHGGDVGQRIHRRRPGLVPSGVRPVWRRSVISAMARLMTGVTMSMPSSSGT
jgi:hypothetical protein